MSLTLDLFTIGKDVMSAALRAERVQKLQVAEHLQNLANVFMAFPAAQRELGYATIVSAAGFLEGYAESLRAQSRRD